MDFKKKLPNPFKLKATRGLQKAIAEATLEGGTEGSAVRLDEVQSALSASSAVEAPSPVATLDMLLGACVDMFAAVVHQDRPRLDTAYEELVTLCEEFRDAVPKAPPP